MIPRSAHANPGPARRRDDTARPAGSGRRRGTGRCRGDREAGNAPLELVLIAPVVLALIALLIAAGRTSVAEGSVQAAARDAARQASIARTPQQAIQDASASAQAELAQEGLDCTPAPTVSAPGAATAFGAPLGQPADVTATVTCWVPLSDLVLPGLPGRKRLTASFSSPLDPYRGR
jgi:Flp pilus assembly protein TadG